MPDAEKPKLLNGPDSLKYMALDDSVNAYTGIWMYGSLISEWINIFNELSGGKIFTGDTKQKEDSFYNILRQNLRDFDTLWKQGIIQEKLLGEKNAKEFGYEADSAMNAVEDLLAQTFSSYTVRIIMPGKTVSHNGFPDSTGVPLWQVRSEYFFTEPYIIKAESKINNIWAWIITVTFLILLAWAAWFPVKKHSTALQ